MEIKIIDARDVKLRDKYSDLYKKQLEIALSEDILDIVMTFEDFIKMNESLKEDKMFK